MSNKNDQRQNELGDTFKLNIDLRGREQEIMEVTERELGFSFQLNEKPGKSTWWNSDHVGALRWRGSYNGQSALLKVQGVKPSTSEIIALTNFEKANHSLLVRPPQLLVSRPWDKKIMLELIVIELIESDKLIAYPTTPEEVAKFFTIFNDYRQNALGTAWVNKPTDSLAVSTRKRIEDDLHMASILFPDHPLRNSADFPLIEEGLLILDHQYNDVLPQFQHCHISTDDVFKPNGDDPRHLYTSNFMWGWEAPYFDATYAYFHYNRLLTDRFNGVSPDLLISQAKIWKDHLYGLAPDDEERKLLNLALLRKTISCLAISDLALKKSDQPIAHGLINLTRSNIHELITELT